ncbi:MAG: BRCT domain-containing protein [Geopsychrobacter sp.]|nr:BRCT domain-containing protein [Geopsychrobacter sp.]
MPQIPAKDTSKYTTKSRFDKAINSLLGMVQGVAIDDEINPTEKAHLEDWLNDYSTYQHKHPFNEIYPVVRDAIEDNLFTFEEHADITSLCERLNGESAFTDQVTADIQRLHGVMSGILADGVVKPKEVAGLSDWLQEHEHLKTCWPYDETESIICAVLQDGKITPAEQKELLLFFSEFISVCDDKTLTRLPVVFDGTVKAVCALDPDICFLTSVFCFTGALSGGLRSKAEKIVAELGGRSSGSVSRKLDYLVIGAEGNPCWAYACYGRKVEKAVALRKAGHHVVIVHENDFWDAVEGRSNEIETEETIVVCPECGAFIGT